MKSRIVLGTASEVTQFSGSTVKESRPLQIPNCVAAKSDAAVNEC